MRAVGPGAVAARLASWWRGVPGFVAEGGEGRVAVSDVVLHERRVEEARLHDLAGWLR
ncbi:hypothetical protein HRV97_09110 [Sphingomonas sp. HHU CXW]|uniref:Uncharacterized protein n=1 Tax=Sphingomonas hominis TaxID=2741495 RepID=A0ABX2JND1_9SPHN|nr:hypothetical protein [Sphingomonas hominis]NTS65320.1 hypothetical protein [Sphingomonas hominis]